ncbi:TOX high mobility group box family member 4-B isoform X3 [Octopus sinensis]|uniref:TOX high mobility group box family member 4-B isoform X3 n=1 Tax=Octopus sinensis TaxID=2607531 RepID=A0A7E6FGP1_9MOLL|nr:TOX high mobility group box family member 4-B isoform X3 [Octopus sinensis]
MLGMIPSPYTHNCSQNWLISTYKKVLNSSWPWTKENTGGSPFHAPSFGDEDFNIPPLGLADSALNYQTRALHGQQVLDIELNNLTQPLSHSSDLSVDCSVLDSLNQNQQSLIPKFPPQNSLDVPDISVLNSVMSTSESTYPTDTVTTSCPTDLGGLYSANLSHPPELMQREQQPLLTISQSQMTTQLGFQTAIKQGSPATSNSTSSPSRESSDDSDDSVPLAQLASIKRTAAMETSMETCTIKKQKAPKKKKKKDPNEPQKPVSAYALFFRDTQAAIKGQNPNASFGEVSKIVASMWDGLDPEHKSVYKKKTETAKKEYLKQLAAYKASLVSQTPIDDLSSEKLQQNRLINSKELMSVTTTGPMTKVNSIGTYTQMTPMHSDSPPLQQIPYSSPPQLPNQNVVSNASTVTSPIHNNLQQTIVSQAGPRGMCSAGPGMCVRNGCQNNAIDNPGWDSEYCSNECVVSHCRDVFTGWVATRQATNSYPVK